MIKTIIAAKHRELNGLWWRWKMCAVRNTVAMITARVTDGDSPVIIAYIHKIIRVIIYRILRPLIKSIGYKRNVTKKVMIPTCSPLNANIWANPEAEYLMRCSSLSIEVSPVIVALRNSMHPSDNGNEAIIWEISSLKFCKVHIQLSSCPVIEIFSGCTNEDVYIPFLL